MADESQTVRSIDWRSTFPFTHIFRGFRIAIHPSKLILALLSLLLIYGGGRLLDSIWPHDYRAVPHEMKLFEETRAAADPSEVFNRERLTIRADLLAERKAELARIGKSDGTFSDLKWHYLADRDNQIRQINAQFAASKDSYHAKPIRDEALRSAYGDASEKIDAARQYEFNGLFSELFGYEMTNVNALVGAARTGNWLSEYGVTNSIFHGVVLAPMWMARHHTVFAIVFGLWFLCVWSIFGGAIARIAAVHVARDEKISIRQSLAFSISKFLSFVSAPLIPLIIVGGIGLLVAIGGALGNIPGIGPIIVGALFFVALAAGFVMTLVLLGALGGVNLMYPTIAVEGSDSFDAISRSFSYLYARPWRLGFYSAVAVLYGAVSYMFVRFFITLMLWVTHLFAGVWFVYPADNSAPLWSTMWPDPFGASGRLMYPIDFTQLTSMQSIGAGLLSVWVYLVILMLGAFAISFYFSVNTVIYYLMRNEVDATEMDDVYLEQVDDEFADPMIADGDTTVPAVVVTPEVAPPDAGSSQPSVQ